ncbi:MAG TPA: hypothetical protein VG984_01765 [Candidatus Paceibacterota bacterium]|nr:hypothetical protein [Candidatus Paceibacterota bacterium]
MKKDRIKDLFLEHLKKIPNIQAAVEQVGVARSTVYKWRDEDEEFRKAMEDALAEGEAMLNDLGENQLYSLMLERHYPSIQFWLRHRNPKFKDKLEITARTPEEREALDAEQDALVERGLAMLESETVEITSVTNDKENNHEKDSAKGSDGVGANQNEQEAASGGGAA